MRLFASIGHLQAIFAVGLVLSGCSSSALVSPGQASAVTPNSRPPRSPQPGGWMARAAKTAPLVYVSGTAEKEVLVYTFPRMALAGQLSGFSAEPRGLCVDQNGDVFVTTDGTINESDIYEYAHGGQSPIAVLSDPGMASGCSVDPKSGDLAVSNLASPGSPYDYGTVAIFPGAHGTPSTYTDAAIPSFLYCAYDNDGNLFADPYDGPSGIIGKLPAGGTTFKNITLDQNITPSSLQWKNGALVVAGATSISGEQPIYKITVSGSVGHVDDPVLLGSKRDRTPGSVQFWLYKDTILGPGSKKRDADLVNLWRYPKGGKPKKTIDSGFGNIGVTVSSAT